MSTFHGKITLKVDGQEIRLQEGYTFDLKFENEIRTYTQDSSSDEEAVISFSLKQPALQKDRDHA